MKKRNSALSIYLLSAIGLSGCSFDYYLKDEHIVARQRVLFEQLCNAEDRSIIYQTARVDGYLAAERGAPTCLRGWNPIFEHGYKYAECTTTNVTGYRLPENADIYRFTLAPQGHPNCGTGEKYFADYTRRTYPSKDSPVEEINNIGNNYKKRHGSKLRDKCLVVKKAGEPMSRYMRLKTLSYYDEDGKLFNDEFYAKYPGREKSTKKGVISTIEDKIIDLSTGRVLARNANYTFFPKGRLYSYATSLDCANGNKAMRHPEVLIPDR